MVPQMGRMRPPTTFTSCILRPTVQYSPSLHLGPCIHCTQIETHSMHNAISMVITYEPRGDDSVLIYFSASVLCTLNFIFGWGSIPVLMKLRTRPPNQYEPSPEMRVFGI